MTATLIIDGNAITDIPSFYAEINRVFMADESWTLGESLDALDDLLRGGYGALHDQDEIALAWTNIEASRAALGEATTRAWLLGKLEIAAFNAAEVQR
ncbi:barstar family protein, partial [Xanthomonas citri pv. citri]